jgi:uncharacterized protein
MSYKHGVYISEEPTSLVSPVQVDSAMPVFFVTAPIHLSTDPYSVTNVPKLCHTYAEAVRHFGFNLKPEIWDSYTSNQVIYSQFVLYGVAPVVIVNVLDPTIHNEVVEDMAVTLSRGVATLNIEGVLIDTVSIKNETGDIYEQGVDYSLSFNREGFVVINALNESISNQLVVSFTKLAPEKVDMYDVIGGYDVVTGKYSGLELINEIYPRFRKVPAQIVAPKFSMNPSVASVMDTKASNINGHFRAIAINDMPTMTGEGSNQRILLFTDVPAFKNDNNFTSSRQYNLYPKLKLGNQNYYYSTQMPGLIARTDHENGGVPYNSPSNKNLRVNGLVYENDEELILNVEV